MTFNHTRFMPTDFLTVLIQWFSYELFGELVQWETLQQNFLYLNYD